jgi:hypothetical protein
MTTLTDGLLAAPIQISSNEGNRVVEVLIGLVFTVIVAFLFFTYGLPALRGTQNTGAGNTGPVINVPDTVDINIKK